MRVGKGNWWLWVFHHADSASSSPPNTAPRRLCMRSSAIGARITGFRTAMAGQMGWQRASISLPRASHPRRPIRDRLWRRGVRARPEGLAQARLRHRRRRDALTDGTLKIYEADLNRRLDRLMSLILRPSRRKLQTIIKKVRRHLFVFVTNRTSRRPTTAQRGRCAPARSIARSPRLSKRMGRRALRDIRSVVETARRRSVRESTQSASPSRPADPKRRLTNTRGP